MSPEYIVSMATVVLNTNILVDAQGLHGHERVFPSIPGINVPPATRRQQHWKSVSGCFWRTASKTSSGLPEMNVMLTRRTVKHVEGPYG